MKVEKVLIIKFFSKIEPKIPIKTMGKIKSSKPSSANK